MAPEIRSGSKMRIYLISKRIVDVLASTAGLILLAPLFVFIAIEIKLDSPGPALYLGKRIGLNGKQFWIYKFRTMHVNREKAGGDTTALNDPRITRIGSFLRRFKLDELPQLINVLKGEMSLVGPRPELSHYTDRYTMEEKQILSVKPGITDLSSVKFSALDERVGAVDADVVFERTILPEKNRLRLQYVRERSFFLDMKIAADTLRAIARRAWR